MDFTLRPLRPDDQDWVRDYTRQEWGTDFVVGHGDVMKPHELPGFVAESSQVVGLLTYQIAGAQCEVVTLNSAESGHGIGTALIEAVREAALRQGCLRLWLITTNDNLNALRFYQKRGFRLVAVRRNGVDRSRLIKPEIPLVGDYGIPLRDEIELEMILTRD